MNIIQKDNTLPAKEEFILALHSSTDELGIGVIDLNGDTQKFKTKLVWFPDFT